MGHPGAVVPVQHLAQLVGPHLGHHLLRAAGGGAGAGGELVGWGTGAFSGGCRWGRAARRPGRPGSAAGAAGSWRQLAVRSTPIPHPPPGPHVVLGLVALDGDHGAHAAHGEAAALVARLDHQLRVCGADAGSGDGGRGRQGSVGQGAWTACAWAAAAAARRRRQQRCIGGGGALSARVAASPPPAPGAHRRA